MRVCKFVFLYLLDWIWILKSLAWLSSNNNFSKIEKNDIKKISQKKNWRHKIIFSKHGSLHQDNKETIRFKFVKLSLKQKKMFFMKNHPQLFLTHWHKVFKITSYWCDTFCYSLYKFSNHCSCQHKPFSIPYVIQTHILLNAKQVYFWLSSCPPNLFNIKLKTFQFSLKYQKWIVKFWFKVDSGICTLQFDVEDYF